MFSSITKMVYLRLKLTEFFNPLIKSICRSSTVMIWNFLTAYIYDCTHSECIMKGECSNMQKVLDSVQNWSNANRMKLNAKKTKDMWICFGKSIPQPPNLYIGDVMIERVNSFKLLGVSCQSNMILILKKLPVRETGAVSSKAVHEGSPSY